MKISKSSWHYKVATWYGNSVTEYDNSCSYTRKVGINLFFAFWLAFIACCFLISIGDFFAWIASMISLGELLVLNPEGCLAAAVIGFISFVVLAMVWIDQILPSIKKISPFQKSNEPSFIKQAYRGWKDKFCTRLKIVD